MSFSVRADRRLIRASARSRRFIRVELRAPEAAPREGRIPVNLAFVLDRSGSMAGEKIARAREATIAGIHSLWPEDRFAVVAYDQRVELVVPTTLATSEAKADAEARVREVDERGSTDLHGGWHAGCREIARGLRSDAVGRCLLLTDGLANAGLTDPDAIVAKVTAMRGGRVATSAFGIGADFDEVFLARLAEAGGGNFHFVESAAQIPGFIAGEVGEALAVTARDVVIVVEAGEGVIVESLNDFPCSASEGAWRVEVGSLYSGQVLDPVVRVTFPEAPAGRAEDVRIRVEDRDGAFAGGESAVTFTHAPHAENDAQPRDRVVDRRVALLCSARAQRDALQLNRDHALDRARAVLEACRDRIRAYAGDDAELVAIVKHLDDRIRDHAHRLDELSRKTMHSSTTMVLKARYLTAPPTGAQALRPVTVAPPAALPSKVAVLATPGLEGVVQRALTHLAAVNALFAPVPCIVLGTAPDASDTIAAGGESSLLDRVAAAAPSDTLRIVFTGRRLGDGWFSHWHGARHTAVVSMADWDARVYSAAPEAFAACEIVLHGLRVLGPGYSPEALRHDETRGCLFDLCTNRLDIEAKLQAWRLCGACRRALSAAGITPGPIEDLLSAVRHLASPAVVH